MRIKAFTMTGLLMLACTAAFAQPPIAPYAGDVQMLNKDIRNDQGDLNKNEWDAAHDQRDISRDQGERNADKQREERDLRDGDLKGAEYWNRQRKDENAEIRHDRRDLAHSRRDIRNDKARIAKDVTVRNHDAGKISPPRGKR
jgi:hypothetical protein